MVTRLRDYIERAKGDSNELDYVTEKNRVLYLGQDDKSPFIRLEVLGKIPIVLPSDITVHQNETVCLLTCKLYGYLPDSPTSGHIRTVSRGNPLVEKLYTTVEAPQWTRIPDSILSIIAEVLQEKYPHIL